MTRDNKLLGILQDSPIIAAVKSDDGLMQALTSECRVVFFLYGTICTIPALTLQVKQAGKLAFVHLDLIEGLSGKDVAADFIRTQTSADGVISTRPNLLRHASELGLLTIQRFFLLDSLAFDNILRQSPGADAIDILPGAMPKIIRRLCQRVSLPIIASGLISDKDDIVAALGAGACAVSTTSPPLWFL